MKAISKTREYLEYCWGILKVKPLLTLAGTVCNVIIFTHWLGLAYCVRQILNGLENGIRGAVLQETAFYLIMMIAVSLLRVAAIMGCYAIDSRRYYYYQNRTRANIMRLIFKKDNMVKVAGNSGKIFETLDDDIPVCLFPPELLTEVTGYTVFTGFSLALLLSINWKVTLFIFIPLSAAIYGVQKLSERMKEKRKENREAHDEVSSFVGDIVDSVLAIKTFGAEAAVLDRYHEGNCRRRRTVLRDILLNSKISALLTGATSIGTVIMMFIAARMMTAGAFGIGDFSLFVGGLGTLASCVDRIVELIYLSKKAEVSYERIVEIAGEENRGRLLDDAGITLKKITSTPYQSKPRVPLVQFAAQNLSFSYEGGNGFQDVNITVQPGELIAIAGGVGSGKSALLGVLAGYMKADSGSLLWNGKEIQDRLNFCVPPNIACSPQRSGFFSSGISTNLCLGCPAAAEEITRAIRLAVLEDTISEMNNGLQTFIGKRGDMLSGGQRQRLALARMFLRNAELNIIDDCVSALDESTQLQFRDRLCGYLKSSRHAAIIAANRTPFLMAADKIFVMQKGRIIAEGQYDELLAGCREFAAMIA
jgi:ATP-binding cassette subfamily B protein